MFFARLAQRLTNFVSVQTRHGRLYEVDTRLRPNGRAGALVSSMSAFRAYQTNKAWVWEHQALLRSRAVAGAMNVREAFERVRRDVLVHHVNRSDLRSEIVRMRARMRNELSRSGSGEFDLKQDAGALPTSNSSSTTGFCPIPRNFRTWSSFPTRSGSSKRWYETT